MSAARATATTLTVEVPFLRDDTERDVVKESTDDVFGGSLVSPAVEIVKLHVIEVIRAELILVTRSLQNDLQAAVLVAASVQDRFDGLEL